MSPSRKPMVNRSSSAQQPGSGHAPRGSEPMDRMLIAIEELSQHVADLAETQEALLAKLGTVHEIRDNQDFIRNLIQDSTIQLTTMIEANGRLLEEIKTRIG